MRSTRSVPVLLAFVLLAPAARAADVPAIRTVAGWLPSGAPQRDVSLHPAAMAYDAAGNLHVADSAQQLIWRLTPDGLASVIAGDGKPCRLGETNITPEECRGANAGDGGLASRAHLTSPDDLVFAPDGDLYFTEARAHDVRKIDGETGIISTVAGSGNRDYSEEEEGAPAVEASLSFPQDLAIDAGGSLYVADWGNQRIRRIALDGTITTVAGCGGYHYLTCPHPVDGASVTGAYIGYPAALAVGPGDRPYFFSNGALWWVDLTEGVLRLVGGKPYTYPTSPDEGEGGPIGEALFHLVGDMEFAPDGSVYVMTWWWNRVQRIDAPLSPASVLRHVAGCFCGPASIDDRRNGFSGDGGDAKKAALALAREGTWTDGDLLLDGHGGLLVSDIRNDRIRRIDLAAGTIDSVIANGADGRYGSYMPYSFWGAPGMGGFGGDGGPAGRAQLSAPSDLAVDAAGNLYVLDRHNERVRRIAPDGTITTVAGGRECSHGCSRSSAPLGDNGPAASALFYGAGFIALDTTGSQLYVSDRYHNRVRQVNLGQVPFTAYPSSGAPITIQPGRVASVYGNGTGCYLLQPDCGDGRFATQVPASPGGLAVDPAGNLYVAESYPSLVRKIDRSTGIVTTVAGVPFTANCSGYGDEGLPGRLTRLCGPASLAIGPDSSLYVTEVGEFTIVGSGTTSRIRRVDLSNPLNLSTVVVGTGTPGYGGDGAAARAAGIAFPHGLAWDKAGALYFADTGNGRVRRVGTDGKISTVAGVGEFRRVSPFYGAFENLGGCGPPGDGGAAAEAGLCAPMGVAIGPGGTLFVGDQIHNRVHAVSGL